MANGSVATVSEVKDRIQLVAPQYDFSNEKQLEIYATDALNQARSDGFEESVIPRAAAYLGAHFYYIAASRAAQIKSQSNKEQLTPLATETKTEFFKSKETSYYLDEYNRLLDSFGLAGAKFHPFGGPTWRYTQT